MKELLTRHWLAKLLSLLLATGIWFLVNNRVRTESLDQNNFPAKSAIFR